MWDFGLFFPARGIQLILKLLQLNPLNGFLKDFAGILVLIKPLRKFIWSFLPSQFINFGYNFKNESSKKDNTMNENIIEGEYKDLDKK